MTRVVETYQSWWGNKPPATKWLIKVGAIVSFALLVLALILDADWLNQQGTFPSIDAFVWDITKGVVLGTIVLAVVDDVGRWARSYGTVSALSSDLEAVSTDVMEQSLKACGFEDVRVDGLELMGTAKKAKDVAALFRNVHDFFIRAHRGAPSTLLDYFNAISQSDSPGALPGTPLHEPLTGNFDTGRLSSRLSDLRIALDGLLNPDASVACVSVASRTRSMVHEVAPQVEALRGQLQKLHKEKQWRGDVELEALNVSSFFHSLSLTLEVVAYEKRTGRPHPYRV